MKKVTVLFCVIALSAFAFSIYAQEQKEEFNKSKNNWFISLGGSANLLVAEQDKEQSVGDRLTLGGALSVGKWFNPNFGMRLQVMGGALKGFNFKDNRGGELKNRYTQPNDKPRLPFPMGYNQSTNDWGKIKLVDNGFWQEFNYGTAGIDVMANLTNLIRGIHKEKNIIDIIPFAGIGYIHAFDNDKTNPAFNGVFGKIGILANFNINSQWAVFLEPQANLTSSEFDGYVGDAVGDGILNLTLGVQYTINRDFSTPDLLSNDEIDYLNKRINDNRSLIENHQDILERQQKLLNDLEECCEEKDPVVVTIEDKYLPEYIRFALDSYEIQPSERGKINDAIAYLKANPDSKLLLIGYADKLTGNTSYNLNLSRKRVESVANEIKRGGISANRLLVEWKGDKEQPYAQNEWNRVVIMVER